MHVYGSLPHAGALDRWPAPTAPALRPAARAPISWPLPDRATRVELPAPAVWAAPDPQWLMSITIAPLRLAPVSWGPPVVVRSPWGPPTLSPSDSASTGTRRLGRRRVWAWGLAAAGVIGAVAAVVANL